MHLRLSSHLVLLHLFANRVRCPESSLLSLPRKNFHSRYPSAVCPPRGGVISLQMAAIPSKWSSSCPRQPLRNEIANPRAWFPMKLTDAFPLPLICMRAGGRRSPNCFLQVSPGSGARHLRRPSSALPRDAASSHVA